MRAIFPFDEINALKQRLESHFQNGKIKSKKDVEDIIDELLDLYLLAYANGTRAINEQFKTDVQPSAEELEKVLYRKIDGKTWEKRVWDWFDEGGTIADIVRIAETEAHRIGNEAADSAAGKAGAKTKTWVCMMLPTSRDTHIYLNGTTVPFDAEFYTFKGNHTMYPGQFGVAEEDVNCHCEVTYR